MLIWGSILINSRKWIVFIISDWLIGFAWMKGDRNNVVNNKQMAYRIMIDVLGL